MIICDIGSYPSVNPCGGVYKVLKWDIEVNEFELKSSYSVKFWTNTFDKGMNTLIPNTHVLNSTTTVHLQVHAFSIKYLQVYIFNIK